MADKRQLPSASVKLSSICLGGRSIRFLVLREKKLVNAPATLDESQGVPLFLASDVLCGCSQMPKNFTRIHARYSKDGMATKLLLKDFRVVGVSHSATVWFYNIRGVFQVVFEYQEKCVQRDCLSKLKDMWLCRYHDDNLSESLTVTMDIHSPVVQENYKLSEPCMGNKTSNSGEEQELFPLTGGEVVIELVKHNRNSGSNFDSRQEYTTFNSSTRQQNQMNETPLLDDFENGKDTSNSEADIVQKVVGQAPQVTDNALSYHSSNTNEDNIQELGKKDVSVDDNIHLCHSCGSLNCPSFQSTENGETSWGICLSSRLESLVHKPFSCSKATQIDTVPRSVTKISVGVQTDQVVSLVYDCSMTISKAVTHRNASPQTDINMDMFAVLTPNCLNSTDSRTKNHQKCSQINFKKKYHSKHCQKRDVMNDCINVVESLIKYLVQMQTDLQNLELSPVIKRFHTILQLLIQDMFLEESKGFPFQLIQDYLDMLGRHRNTETVYDSWGISSQRNTFLHIVSHWLGKEFHKFEPKISQRVEDFKQRHINCIDNLPPAESIVDLVFPSFMKELIVSWTSQFPPSPCVRGDHDYSPPVKKLCANNSSSPAYPLVQHILEFANHALVSGVAHVVYSRLRHST